MNLTDKYAEIVYRLAKSRHRLKIIVTSAGAILWFGYATLSVIVSLLVDKPLPIQLLMPKPVTLSISVPLLTIGGIMVLWTYYRFFKARGTPIPVEPPKNLVTTGLYAYVRNPMHLGWFIFLFGLGVFLNSFSLIFIFTPLFILVHVFYVRTIEEKELEKKFGEQYLEYKESVPMFIPRFRRRWGNG